MFGTVFSPTLAGHDVYDIDRKFCHMKIFSKDTRTTTVARRTIMVAGHAGINSPTQVYTQVMTENCYNIVRYTVVVTGSNRYEYFGYPNITYYSLE